jgi:NAD(P)-dependent dehydrogenase (short-subunit alcohol dehydrogenase family)
VCGTFDIPSLRKSALTDDDKAAMAEQIGLRRIARADEIVGTALYLASPAASYVNGSLLVVDGASQQVRLSLKCDYVS